MKKGPYEIIQVKNFLNKNGERLEDPRHCVMVILDFKTTLVEVQLLPASMKTKDKQIVHLLYELKRHDYGVFIALAERRNRLKGTMRSEYSVFPNGDI